MLYQKEDECLTIYSCSGIIYRYLFCLNNALDIKKRLATLAGRNVAFYLVGKWIPAIVDHLFYVVMNTNKVPLRVAWWNSLMNHIASIHVHETPEFPVCLHDAEPQMTIGDDGFEYIPAYIQKGDY